MSKLSLIIAGAFIASLTVLGSTQQSPPPNAAPLYYPCPRDPGVNCNEDLGHDKNNTNTNGGCTGWCTQGPMRISPDPIEGCQGQSVTINVRIIGGRMDIMGNAIDNSGGSIDWGDGQKTPIFSSDGLVQDATHTYIQANTYYPSATYAQQFRYTGNGSCGYRCRLQQATIALIYLPGSPECATGTFKATSKSQARKKAAINKLNQIVQKRGPQP